MRMTDLKAGWAIVGNDGQPLGTVQAVGQNYVLASRGRLAAPLYVPASAIANVEREVVHLNLAKREAEQMGWEEAPRESDAPEATGDSDPLHRHV
jgi:hypothetical protein